MKGGKHRSCPPAEGDVLEVLRLLAALGWQPETTEAVQPKGSTR